MITKDEYVTLKKLIQYKEKHFPDKVLFILGDNLYNTLSKKQRKYIIAILQKLDENGLIADLYFVHHEEPHMINITDLGIYEYEHYRKNKIDKYKHDFIIALMTAILTLLLPVIVALISHLFL